jgi:ATP-dependent protease ClpP protease subunit
MKKNKSIYIYDEIGGNGINAMDIVRELDGVSGDVDVHINSGGGSVSQGVSIYNTIKGYSDGRVTVYVDGLAASIASIIALAGEKLIMAEGSLLMWHYAHTIMAGNANDLRHEADVLEQHNSTLIDIYASNTPLSREEIDAMMSAETWLTAAEALELGIATEIAGELKQAASVNIEIFNNAPNELLDILDLNSKSFQTPVEPEVADEKIEPESEDKVEENAENLQEKAEKDSFINSIEDQEENNFARLEAAYQRLATIEKLAAL